MQLTWTGESHHVASVAAHPTPILAGALADSLLLLRPSAATGELEVASRAVNMLQPLVLGWCSLAACGLLPKLSSARAALQQVRTQTQGPSRATECRLCSLPDLEEEPKKAAKGTPCIARHQPFAALPSSPPLTLPLSFCGARCCCRSTPLL
jgi:hypothetical protein